MANNGLIAGQEYDAEFPVFDAAGKFVPGATFASVEISRDGGPLTPLTNPPFPVLEGAGTATPGAESGVYTVHLDGSETLGVVSRISGKVSVSTPSCQDCFFLILVAGSGAAFPGGPPGSSGDTYSFPPPVERRAGPVAAVYEATLSQDIAAGGTLYLTLDKQVYDAPYYTQPTALPGMVQEPDTGPYVNITFPWTVQIPFYAGYQLELFGVVQGGPVDIYYVVNLVAYIWAFGVTGSFDLHKLIVLDVNDIVEYFVAVPGTVPATLFDLKGAFMLVSI